MQQDNDKGHLVIILILIDDQEIPYMALITYCSCLFARCFVRLFAIYKIACLAIMSSLFTFAIL